MVFHFFFIITDNAYLRSVTSDHIGLGFWEFGVKKIESIVFFVPMIFSFVYFYNLRRQVFDVVDGTVTWPIYWDNVLSISKQFVYDEMCSGG